MKIDSNSNLFTIVTQGEGKKEKEEEKEKIKGGGRRKRGIDKGKSRKKGRGRRTQIGATKLQNPSSLTDNHPLMLRRYKRTRKTRQNKHTKKDGRVWCHGRRR